MTEMDIYDHESYMLSMENLLMLKMLHDEGVDVRNYDDFMVHIHRGSFGEDILFSGVSDLFDDTYVFSSCELDEQETHEEFQFLKKESAEYFLVIRDDLFKSLSESQCNDLIQHFDPGNYDGGASIELLPSNDGIVIFIDWLSAHGMSELLEGIIKMKRYAKKLRGEINGNKHTDVVGTSK